MRSVYDRRIFASVFGASQTADRHRREKGVEARPETLAVRSLQSGLFSKNRGIWAQFTSLVGSKGGNSLHSRLAGGETDIRTFSTSPPPASG